MSFLLDNIILRFSHIYSFSIIIFLLLLNIIINENNSKILLEGKLPKAILLSSGKYFIVHNQGFSIYNSDFSFNKIVYNFTDDEVLEYDFELENTFIYEFIKNNNSFIFCLIKGSLLFIIKNNIYENKYNLNIGKEITCLILYKNNNNFLQYITIFIENYQAYFNVYELNFSFDNNSNILKYPNITKIQLYEKFISCQKMNYSLSSNEVLVCFCDYNNIGNLYSLVFDIDNNFNIINQCKYNLNYSDLNFYYLKSSLSLDKKKCFVCILIYDFTSSNYYINCLSYDIEKNLFGNIKTLANYHKFEIYFFPETNQYVSISYKIQNYDSNLDNYFNLIFLNENFSEINQNNE